MRLTDLRIKQLKAPEEGQKTFFDDGLRGFGVRVSQGGSKSFVVMYGPKRRLRTLGRYPSLSLADARKEAKRIQAEVLDLDTLRPQSERVSFEVARTRFLTASKRKNRERTYADYHRLLHRHFSYTQNLVELTRSDIMRSIDRLSATPSEQQHAFVTLRIMLNWCVKQGYIDHSPLPPMSFKSAARSNVVSDEDLKAIWQRSEEVGYPYGSIIRLLILSGQRRGEIASLRRSWLEDDLIVFPATFTKNRREHRLPISPLIQAELDNLPEIGDLFFPARGSEDRPFNGWGKSKERFDAPIQVEAYTLHDLRRTFSSNMARIGTPIHVTEKLLNHVSGTLSGVAAVYNRYSYQDEMQAALAQHDQFLTRLVSE
ncbi:MAG: site-specific integrase [Pseudomonadota bacterium]